MGDEISTFLASCAASPERPLAGLTVLVVEDSRFACEAMRLLCLHSGARIRRADCLRSAHRHLQTYRPAVVIVDLGLPDGSGADLIAELAALPARSMVVLGTSGDASGAPLAMAAGADGFLAKPVESLADFQSLIVGALPSEMQIGLAATGGEAALVPDPLALRDDLSHAAEMLDAVPDAAMIDYLTHFLAGLARSARDPRLEAAAASLARAQSIGTNTGACVARVAGLVRARLAAGAAL